MRLKVTFKYFTENNDGLPNRKVDWCIVTVEKFNASSYELMDIKTIEYHRKHHRGCMYGGIVGVERL